MTERDQLNIRLTLDDRKLLDKLKAKLGLSISAITKYAWRKLAEREGIKTGR